MSRASDRRAIAEAADSILAALPAGMVFNAHHDLLRETALACRELLLRPEAFTDHQLGKLVREAALGLEALGGRFDRETVAARGLVGGLIHLAAEALTDRGYGAAIGRS